MSVEALPVLNHPEIGPITTIRDDGLPFKANDLGDILAVHAPRSLDHVVTGIERPIRYIPKRPELILRWNNSSDRPLPVAPDKATPFMVEADKEFDRLQKFGMAMLERNIFVVEHDEREKRPIVYTVVKQHHTDSMETIIDYVPLRNKPHIQKQLLEIAHTLTNYYSAPETDRQALYDVDYGQCAQDGILLDYDPKMYKGKDVKLRWVDYLYEWVDDYIQPSATQEDILNRINSLQRRLLEDVC